MTILFHTERVRPDDLEQKGAEAWDQSLFCWSVHHSDAGFLGYLGLVPLDLLGGRGYWWFDPRVDGVPRGVLREAKTAFAALAAGIGWETYAHTEISKSKTGRFAGFFGFHRLGVREGQEYHVRRD